MWGFGTVLGLSVFGVILLGSVIIRLLLVIPFLTLGLPGLILLVWRGKFRFYHGTFQIINTAETGKRVHCVKGNKNEMGVCDFNLI